MVLEEAVADYIELLCNDYDEIALPVRDLCITIVKKNYPSINISYRKVAYPTVDDIYKYSYNIDDVGKRNEFQANLKNKVELAKMEDELKESKPEKAEEKSQSKNRRRETSRANKGRTKRTTKRRN